jgi:hypothetical protein
VRFLADESCDFAVVRALRNAGHDVLAVSEISPRADDAQILNLAFQQERILKAALSSPCLHGGEWRSSDSLVQSAPRLRGGIYLQKIKTSANLCLPMVRTRMA